MLTFKLTDLWGRPLARFNDHLNGHVECPLSGARTAKVDIPLEDPKLVHALPLRSLLKVALDGVPLVSAPLTTPRWLPDEGKVELACDSSIRLQRSWIDNTPLWWILAGFPPMMLGGGAGTESSPANNNLDARIADVLAVNRSSPGPDPSILGDGIPDLGISYTLGGEAHWVEVAPGSWVFEYPGMGTSAEVNVSRGTAGWAVLQQISQLVTGPDFELEPIEPQEDWIDYGPPWGYHPPPVGEAIAGGYPKLKRLAYAYQRLAVYARKGRELHVRGEDAVVLEYRCGKHNANGFEWSPGGDKTVNDFTDGDPSGQGGDVRAHDATSIGEYGFYREFQQGNHQFSAGDGSPAPSGGVLNRETIYNPVSAKAQQEVAAYREPPDFFTVKPAPPGAGPDFGVGPAFPDDFLVGDTIAVKAQLGATHRNFPGRVIEVDFDDLPSGVTQQSLKCVPRVTIPTDDL